MRVPPIRDLLQHHLTIPQIVLHRLEDFFEIFDKLPLLVFAFGIVVVLFEGAHDLDVVADDELDGFEVVGEGVEV